MGINGSVARIDFSLGDYICENHVGMGVVFGESLGYRSADEFVNLEAQIDNVSVEGICPFGQQSKNREQCCAK